MSGAGSHYEVLGVSQTASSAELRRAYLRLVREHPPESDPGRFRLISEAYQVLSNAEKRKEYDSREAIPDDIAREAQELFEQVIEDSDRDAAKALYRLVTKRAPYKSLRFTLGVALDHIDEHDRAINVFRGLLDEDPENAAYATWLGDSLLKSGNESAGTRMLQEAIVLDKKLADPYFCLFWHYLRQSRDDDAIKVIDRALEARAPGELQSLPLLSHKIIALARKRDWAALRAASNALLACVPSNDEDARNYALGVFLPVAQLLQKSERPDLLHFAMEVVSQLDPSNAELRKDCKEMEKGAELWRSRDALIEDKAAPDWIKAFVMALTDENFSDVKDAILEQTDARVRSNPKAAVDEWFKWRQRYPQTLGMFDDLWNQIRKDIQSSPASSTAQGKRPIGPPRSFPAEGADSNRARGRTVQTEPPTGGRAQAPVTATSSSGCLVLLALLGLGLGLSIMVL